jgi:anaerobic selenocysteine-containing dehydrogenase
VLLEVSRQLGGKAAEGLPWKTYDEMVKSSFDTLRQQQGSITSTDADDFWKQARQQGVWSASESKAPVSAAQPTRNAAPYPLSEPQFAGGENDFPFHFLPYASQTLYDGSLAHLPWMQETPAPLSTAMWGSWVEINPKTAERLNIQEGDLVEVASLHGKVQAPALIYPGIAPDIIAMPVGQGHENFTRYATARGANPLSILAPTLEPETGSLAWAATRVAITRVGKGNLTLFGGGLSRFPMELER